MYGLYVQPPTSEEIRQAATKFHIDLSEYEVEYISANISSTLDSYARLDQLTTDEQPVEYNDRDTGYRPDSDEDPLNAFVTKCEINERDDGILSGYRIGLKDNIPVAGVAMTLGSNMMDSYTPNYDATVVRRLLDEGATITGKMNLSSYAYSGATSEITATGPVLNPRNPEYAPGGSSSGSAAGVVNGDVDIALGTDQGGSMRIPASWSGCVSLKPTWGLVPYTGIVEVEDTLDHTGPLTRNVEDCALALEAIAGVDGVDPRQDHVEFEPKRYAAELTADVDDLTIGLLREGFDLEFANPAVIEIVRESVRRFEALGAEVKEVSMPWHPEGVHIWTGIVAEGTAAKIRAEGGTVHQRGNHYLNFTEEFGKARRVRADDYPPSAKSMLVLGQYLADEYQSRYYYKSQMLADKLTRKYDEVLDEVDLIGLPTTADVAPALMDDPTPMDTITRGFNAALPNTAQFDVTGHPAISVPCGVVDGLPVGLQLIGRRFSDDTVLNTAYAFEQHVDWENSTAS